MDSTVRISVLPMTTENLMKPLINTFNPLKSNSSPYLKNVPSFHFRFYYDWLIQSVTVIAYYSIVLAMATFFIGITLYVRAMVTDLKKQMEHLHKHESNASKFTCLKDGAIFHGKIMK